ncbi:MAG TPA: NADH-quinone oxidoreductase subunit H [Candidatus Caldiarchaeum subterraneum]|uniref:NADH-quinone oxidoreductase subunit H n=1 Tax=Caldiarchaeum subterraneum TaxID=311458 RepID=A0A832ZVV6_CALS0|nr:NADH-quinone oxidoreductase subunit H [Candidatus Caldarchaeum subterraneum]
MSAVAQVIPEPVQALIRFIASDAFVKAAIFPGAMFISLLGLFIVWYERKLLARLMLRIGPFHVGKYGGTLQLLADAVKFLSKEFIVPENARARLFILAPMLAVIVDTMPFAFLPFSPKWVIFPSDIGLLLFFLFIAISPIPLILAGWASGGKYSLIGIVRFAFQVFAYEIPFFLALTGVVVMARSFNLVEIVEAQSVMPFIIPQIIGFIAFFITLIAETERIPFDIPTAEQELVEGWKVEYSASGFLMLMLAQYTKTAALAVLTVLIYLGGWNGPAIPGVPAEILQPFWVIVKTLLLLTVILIMRGIYPRITIEKILELGWRVLIPMTLINLLVVAVITSWPVIF